MTCHTLNRRLCSLGLRGLTIAAVICGTTRCAMAAEDHMPHMTRVRSEDSSLRDIVREATSRSTTFRHLIETIDASDGLVYIDQGKCGHSVRACLLLSVKVAGPNRVLRIVVSSSESDCTLMASIGHELRHAVEALSDPHVRSNSEIYAFFERVGPTSSGRFETEAAMLAGLDVEAQCAHSRSR